MLEGPNRHVPRTLVLALIAGALMLGSGCASTLRSAVTLPFEVAGHTLDLAGKSLDVASKGVDLAARSQRLALGRFDSEIETAHAGAHVLGETLNRPSKVRCGAGD